MHGPFRVPTDRNWSKQHAKIRTPRPLVDRFNLGNLHPNKEWWRERRVAPATFMGFPDVTKAEVRGTSLYVEQMDAATLSVIVDKCANEGIKNQEFWAKFSWRAQQLCPTLLNTDVAYLFRGFSRGRWFDSHLALSLWARIDWLLPSFSLADLAVVAQGFNYHSYINERYHDKVFNHMLLLVEARDDWTVEELAQAASSLPGIFWTDKKSDILSNISKQLDGKDFSLIPIQLIASLIHSFSISDLPTPPVLFQICAHLRESGKLADRTRIGIGDHAASLLVSLHKTGLSCTEPLLVSELIPDMYDNIFQLSHQGLMDALTLSSLNVIESPKVFKSVLLLRLSREIHRMHPEIVCSILSILLHSGCQDCVSESLSRIAAVGIHQVSPFVLSELKSALNNITAPKTTELDSLTQLLALSV